MTPFQKTIKYGAIAFGIYLSVMIIGMIIFGITTVAGVTFGLQGFNKNEKTFESNITTSEQNYENIENIEIDLKVSKLNIKKGNTLKVETANISEEFECKTYDKTLIINDKKVDFNLFNINYITPEITIYIPEGITLNNIEIKNGANETKVEYLNCKKLKIKLGAGKFKIYNMIVEDANIETGAGETIIYNSAINNLKLDSGIGNTEIASKIHNKASIKSGIGRLKLDLIGNQEEYTIKPKTGIGRVMINNKTVSNNQVIGNGNIDISIDSGIGETQVDFTK